MKTLTNFYRAIGIFCLGIVLTACVPPPFFLSLINIYAIDNGSDVDFVLVVPNEPTSIACFNGNVIMDKTDANTFVGTASYLNDLGGKPGITTVNCTASNATGSITAYVGTITLVENQMPVLVTLSPVIVYDNGGAIAIDQPLVDTEASSYLAGATYTKASGTSLPNGLSINPANGHLVGTTTLTEDFHATDIVLNATTVVGSDASNAIDLTVGDDTDADSDGVPAGVDCDDEDADVGEC